MIKLSSDKSEQLKIGIARLFALDSEGDRVQGVRELLASCGFIGVTEFYTAVQFREDSTHLLEMDRDFATRLMGESWLLFMNHGYAPADDDSRVFPTLCREFESWRHQANLYFHLLDLARPQLGLKAPADCDLLDVGCGRGGGLAVMKRSWGLRNAVGIDINPHQIAFCNERHKSTGARFIVGSATELPVADASFDIVTNVESSHCYRDFPAFMSEVRRVLRPNGLFLFADNRDSGSERTFALEAAFLSSGLELLHQQEITEQVRQACILDAKKFARVFASDKAEIVRRIAADSALAYASGVGVYVTYILQRSG